MKWIDFKEREPIKHREIRVRSYEGKESTIRTNELLDYPYLITHWAEIEPPGERWSKSKEERFQELASLEAQSLFTDDLIIEFRKLIVERRHHIGTEPPPTPDPFEEWFRTVGVFIFDNPNGKYELAKAAYDKGWDAAIKWKEKQ